MSSPSDRLVLTTAPFARDQTSTTQIMAEVLAWALVMLAAGIVHFGIGALLVVVAATAGSVVTEWFFTRGSERFTLTDNTAVLTGVLLGLTLPPAFPLWMAFLGGIAGIGLGKLIWGGLGQNMFNPALVGRAFLQAAFPTAITTWKNPVDYGLSGLFDLPSRLFAAPLMKAAPLDGITGATPLGAAKFEGTYTAWTELFWGHTGGSLGETSALLLIIAAVFMARRRIFDWRLPVSTVLSVLVFGGLIWGLTQAGVMDRTVADPVAMVLSGGLLFGAVFMVTDPVTTPTTVKGAWLYGLGVGLLVILIRVFGGLPEGVMYAILLMNAATPHLNAFTQPRPFGGKR